MIKLYGLIIHLFFLSKERHPLFDDRKVSIRHVRIKNYYNLLSKYSPFCLETTCFLIKKIHLYIILNRSRQNKISERWL